MTGNMEMLMRMRKAKIQKEANVQTAEDIGKKQNWVILMWNLRCMAVLIGIVRLLR